MNEKSKQDALKMMMRLLSKRDYFSFELMQKLETKGINKEILSEIQEEIIAKGYVNDLELAKRHASALVQKGWSHRFIQLKIAQKSQKKFSLKELELKPDANEIAEQIERFLSKKKAPRPLKNRDDKRKWILKCQRRGFEYEQIVQLIEERWQ